MLLTWLQCIFLGFNKSFLKEILWEMQVSASLNFYESNEPWKIIKLLFLDYNTFPKLPFPITLRKWKSLGLALKKKHLRNRMHFLWVYQHNKPKDVGGTQEKACKSQAKCELFKCSPMWVYNAGNTIENVVHCLIKQ